MGRRHYLQDPRAEGWEQRWRDGEGPAGLPGPGDSRVTREYRGGRTDPEGP